MQERSVSTWEEFESEISELRKLHKSSISGLLFRGHGDSSWPLHTTLERDSGTQRFLVSDYYRLISVIQSQIETFTDTKWELPGYPEILKSTSEYDPFSRELSFGQLPAYKYMAYLRHHGFPSPLLDWTRSQYVAAYFAFRKSSREEEVSIYVYCDSPQNAKFRSSNAPTIHRFGPNIQTHRRHFLQQSEYTVCMLFDQAWYFVAHAEVFDRDTRLDVIHQDALWKFNLPGKERIRVLRLLDQYNLNAYSLFGSDESLMETMALRELHLKKD